MITHLDDAGHNLSRLVQLAADGEDVVITVHGRPTARLTGMVAKVKKPFDRKEWAAELSVAAESARTSDVRSTPQAFWDDLRDERI